MFGSVLVATDFTQGAAAALDRAFRLPLPSDAQIDLVHVVPHDADQTIAEAAGSALERERDRACASFAIPVRCVTSCVRGTPFVEIVRAARVRDVELIVIGVHGDRPFRDLFVGSTASRVIRTGDTPVLLVRRPASAPYRDVLVSLALCDVDRRLIQLGKKVSTSRLSAVHVVHVPFEGFQATTAPMREQLRVRYRAEATSKLHAMLAELDPNGSWNTAVTAGDTCTAILDEARRQQSDLLIAGTHARSGIAHALLGSVAETLILAAPCDVLVARPTRFTFELP